VVGEVGQVGDGGVSGGGRSAHGLRMRPQKRYEKRPFLKDNDRNIRTVRRVRMFELRRLRLLHELALRGTIAEVAASLSYSPSTVSQQLSLLEREAGVSLLEPDGRRLRLTPQGRLLAQHAARALELDEAARASLTAHAGWETVRL